MNRQFAQALVTVAILFATATCASAQLSNLPFKGQDFRDDERAYWGRALHSPSGVQMFGYDFDVRRYDSSAKKWVWATGTGDKNGDWHVYGRRVYAMRSGKIIACWRNAPENPKMGMGPGKWHEELTKYPSGGSRIYGGGNGMWIEHDDGSRAEYAHFQPGTVPAALCPHNDELMPAVINSPDVTNAWQYIRVPPSQQATVTAGQFLGRVGNTGTSSNPHLHIHMETGGTAGTTKSGGTPVVINFKSGLYINYSDSSGPYVEWKSFAGKPIPPGPVLVWPSRSLRKEYARHGYDAAHFGALFQHLADSGYWLEWIDTYNVGGKDFINHVWRPAKGKWRCYFLVDAAKYQQEFDQAKADKFFPVFVESSRSGGRPLYTAVFVKNKPGKYRARHGLTRKKYLEELAKAKEKKLVPINVSVVSLGLFDFLLRYTVLFRSGNIGSWEVKTDIAAAEYQHVYDNNSAAGRKPLYVNAYLHGGKHYFSAIFGQVSTSARKDRHGMSSGEYQNEFDSALKAGMLTHVVTGVDGYWQHRFTASWWK